MIGDSDLNVDATQTPPVARRYGLPGPTRLATNPTSLPTSHRRRSFALPAGSSDLIDLDYATATSSHTPQDTMDKLSIKVSRS